MLAVGVVVGKEEYCSLGAHAWREVLRQDPVSHEGLPKSPLGGLGFKLRMVGAMGGFKQVSDMIRSGF